jgi:hypothetical protein
MKSLLSLRSRFASIEPLEARIAPATVFRTGVPNVLGGNDIDYNSDNTPFINTGSGMDQISKAVGGDADTYYLRMSAGDVLQIFNTTNGLQNYLTVNSGNIVAFFIDKNSDKEVNEGELVSLSLGKDAAILLAAGLDGSVVTNLNENGTKSTTDDTIDMGTAGDAPPTSGLVSGQQGIKSLQIVGGGVGGSILSGGNVQNVFVNGTVGSILAGTAATGATFDLFPGRTGGEGVVSFNTTGLKAGASITNVVVDGIGTDGVGVIAAGGGGTGAAGGSITKVQIVADRDGFTLQAGAGGNGPKGGAGGSVSSIYVAGIADDSANSQITILGGAGGTADQNKGGGGGQVSNIFVGFQLVGGRPFSTTIPVIDDVAIQSGAGGAGKIAGAGGLISKINIRVATPDAAGDEISIIGGAGGDNNVGAGGKTGAGASLIGLDIQSQTPSAASVLLQAGNAGLNTAGEADPAKGGNGGSITSVQLVSTIQTLLAGNGSDGKSGGAGGSIRSITLPEFSGVTPSTAIFNAGVGGNGDAQRGGAGGAITAIAVQNGDFAALRFNTGNAANGGSSVGNKGGAGGAVSNLDLLDLALRADEGSVFGDLLIRTGIGGNGAKGGGAGGSLSNARFIGIDTTGEIRTGAGGSVIGIGAGGKGGIGGSIQGVNLALDGNTFGPPPAEGEEQQVVPVTATVVMGAGGSGAGNGAGGAGGGARTVSIRVAGSALMEAGDGGNAETGRVGNGGSILVSGVFADSGSGALLGGDAGTTGGKAGNGGSISGTSSVNLVGLYASDDLTVRAGDGSQGGSGGSVRFLGYGSTSESLTPTPSGNILIRAGDGSGAGSAAGAGGSIDNVSGSVSSVSDRTTTIRAGDGGGVSAKGAAGGSVTNLILSRGGFTFDETGNIVIAENNILTVEAGNAGDSNAARGANGGSVRVVSVDDISGTRFQRVAAGDGGDAAGRGGNGGSVIDVKVVGTPQVAGEPVALTGDIGIRTGAPYGYTSMGGIFAGAGGNGGIADGKAGDVINIGADSIAAIVAGRQAAEAGLAPSQVGLVDFITLNGDRLLDAKNNQTFVREFNEDGSPTYRFDPAYYATANFVGAVANINRDQTWRFEFNDTNGNGLYDLGEIPIDGLIVAKNINQKNFTFTPEARYADLLNGNPEEVPFYDYNNRS